MKKGDMQKLIIDIVRIEVLVNNRRFYIENYSITPGGVFRVVSEGGSYLVKSIEEGLKSIYQTAADNING